MTSDWYCSDADEHGFVHYEKLQHVAAHTSLDDFLARFPIPGIMVIYRGLDEAANEGMDPGQSGVRLLTMSMRSTSVMRYLSRVAFLCKRPGAAAGPLISIGRSTVNDIIVAVESVSKLHGSFSSEDGTPAGAFCYADHGSTNGSRLNGELLEAKTRHALKDGDIVQLGAEVMFEVMYPETLHKRAQR